MEAAVQPQQSGVQQMQAQQVQIEQQARAQKIVGYRSVTGADGMTAVKDGQMEQTSFGAVLEQFLSGEDSASVEETDALLKALEEQVEDGDTDAAMQLLAQLFAAQPALVQQVDPELLAQLTGQQTAGVVQTANNLPQFAMAALLGQQAAGPESTQQAPLQGNQTFVSELAQQTGMEIVQTATGAGAGAGNGEAQTTALLGEAGYQRALYQAQRQMEGGTDKAAGPQTEETAATTAKDSKQTSQVPAAFPPQPQLTHTSQAAQMVEQTGGKEDLQNLLAQVKTGLLEGAQKGDKDFVIKLKPEGLGEITVRMVQQGDKICMDILASNQNTQRLLAGELTSLRQAMEPYHVVVTAQQADGGSTAFNMEQQMRQGFTQQEHHGRQENTYYLPQDDRPDEASDPDWDMQMASGLDVYT